jgi:hypothetical protein
MNNSKSRINHWNLIRVIVSALFFYSGSKLFYGYITDTLGFGIILQIPLAITSFFGALYIPSKTKYDYPDEIVSNYVQIVIGLMLLLPSIWLVDHLRNISPIKYACEYYNEDDLSIEFRENMTFKAIEEGMGSDISYGRYIQHDSMIILQDEVILGMSVMNDTMIVTESGIKFKLKTPWRRADSGILNFKRNG